jgi:hypothetical protein
MTTNNQIVTTTSHALRMSCCNPCLLDQELPANHCTQVEKLHPVKEDLMILMKKNRLPIHLYQDFLSWGARASLSEYDFKDSSIYKTTVD